MTRDLAAYRAELAERLAVPLIAAPMFLVSNPALVIAVTRAGGIGAFPTLNARTPKILDSWLAEIGQACAGCPSPWAFNIVMSSANQRRDVDLELAVAHKVPLIISSVGPPDPVVAAVQGYGGRVFCDVATLRHARRAVSAGVDGLILLTAGAGGHTGWLNPFAFLRAVREFFDGPIAIAGGITQGRELAALRLLGADLGYVGTPFIATPECLAPDSYRETLLAAGIDDVVETRSVTGMRANFVKGSLMANGYLDAEGQPQEPPSDRPSWNRVWSAGHGVGAVKAVRPSAEIVADFAAEWRRFR